MDFCRLYLCVCQACGSHSVRASLCVFVRVCLCRVRTCESVCVREQVSVWASMCVCERVHTCVCVCKHVCVCVLFRPLAEARSPPQAGQMLSRSPESSLQI